MAPPGRAESTKRFGRRSPISRALSMVMGMAEVRSSSESCGGRTRPKTNSTSSMDLEQIETRVSFRKYRGSSRRKRGGGRRSAELQQL
jgi:hypothetical protein